MAKFAKPLLFVFIGIGLGSFLTWFKIKSNFSINIPMLENHLGPVDMINPLIGCADHTPELILQSDLEKNLNTFIDEIKANESLAEISVLYRDLTNGPTFAINRDLTYTGASLLKVPIMIGYLRLIERDPKLAQQMITYTPAVHDVPDIQQLLPLGEKMVPGKKYSVEELLMRMITASDNSAMVALREYRPEAGIQQTLKNMGVPLTKVGDELTITVRDYSSILRILYNATYLNKESSNLALKILAMSQFKDGLRAGVPSHIKVASKFGERFVSGSLVQFHDCGIIYANSPYLLCVMTRGNDMAKLVSVVNQISARVYQQVTQGQ